MADGQSAGTLVIPLDIYAQTANSCIAWPIADQALSQEILDLVQQSAHYRQVQHTAFTVPVPIANPSIAQKGC